jgi:type II secretory pathway pseudopilin PulG
LPIRRGSPLSAPASPGGFSIIEVVVSLALCALVAGAVASSLTTALRAERRAVEMRENRRASDQLQQALSFPAFFADLTENLLQDWALTPAVQMAGEGTNQLAWTVWELSRADDVSRRTYVATRMMMDEDSGP